MISDSQTLAAIATVSVETSGWQVLESIATAVAAIVTIGAVLYARREYRAGQQTRKDLADAQDRATWPYVVVSPIPELCDGLHLTLRVKNYGPTAAHDIKLTFPNTRVEVRHRRNSYSGGYAAEHELPLASTLLAPGQEVIETTKLFEDKDELDAFAETLIRVDYKSSDEREHTHEYTVRFAEADRTDPHPPLVEVLQDISTTLQGWSGPGRRALLVDTREAIKRRDRDFVRTLRTPPCPPEGARDAVQTPSRISADDSGN